MLISKTTLREMKVVDFHSISEDEEKMCAICEHGTSLLGGTPAYCYATGLKIDWYFVCKKYKVIEVKNDTGRKG